MPDRCPVCKHGWLYYREGHAPNSPTCLKNQNAFLQSKIVKMEKREKINYKSIFTTEQLAASVCSRLAFEGFIPLLEADIAKKFAMDALNENKQK